MWRTAIAAIGSAAVLAGCSAPGVSAPALPGDTGTPAVATARSSVAAARHSSRYLFDVVSGDRAGDRVLGRYGVNGIDGRLIDRTGTVQVRIVAGFVYLNGPGSVLREYLGRSADRVLAGLDGRWVRVAAASTSGRELVRALAPAQAIQLPTDAELAGARSYGHTTIDGQRAEVVSLPRIGVTLYVAARGTPYPLRLLDTAQDGASESFGSWGAPFAVRVPDAARTVDLGSATSAGAPADVTGSGRTPRR